MRRTIVVFGLGLLGLLSLLAFPFEALVPNAPMPAVLLRPAALIQPLILLVGAALLGGWAAPRVGLRTPVIDAVLERQPWPPDLRDLWLPSAVVGVLTAGVLLAYAAVAAPYFASHASSLPVSALDPPLVSRLLYGGLTEEVLLRWGVMSAFVWLATKALRQRPPSASAYWSGIFVAAALFAVGHLPLFFLLTPNPPAWMLAAVLAGNMAPGMMFGWLFWRRGLEAAMLAHALAHALAVAGGALLAAS